MFCHECVYVLNNKSINLKCGVYVCAYECLCIKEQSKKIKIQSVLKRKFKNLKSEVYLYVQKKKPINHESVCVFSRLNHKSRVCVCLFTLW